MASFWEYFLNSGLQKPDDPGDPSMPYGRPLWPTPEQGAADSDRYDPRGSVQWFGPQQLAPDAQQGYPWLPYGAQLASPDAPWPQPHMPRRSTELVSTDPTPAAVEHEGHQTLVGSWDDWFSKQRLELPQGGDWSFPATRDWLYPTKPRMLGNPWNLPPRVPTGAEGAFGPINVDPGDARFRGFGEPPPSFAQNLDDTARYYLGPHAWDALSKVLGLAKMVLPGSGTVQSQRDALDAKEAAEQGRYGEAATSMATGVVNAGLDWLPFGKGAATAFSIAAKKGPKVAGEVAKDVAETKLGLYPTTTPERIAAAIKSGGYSVNLPSGVIPNEGLMVAKYRPADPHNTVIPRTVELMPAHIEQHTAKNAGVLAQPEHYLSVWKDPSSNTIYLGVSRRFEPEEVREATKFGERTGQLSGWNIGKQEPVPVGSWYEFVKSPEFADRVHEMAAIGAEYLKRYPTKAWWDIEGTPLERVYGADRLSQLAGYLASTSPVTSVRENMQLASEYMRRLIKGEPTIQPEFRMPENAMTYRPGGMMPMERGRAANLEKSTGGDLDHLGGKKVGQAGAALKGDPNAVVLDRHWARLAEDPARGIFTSAQHGLIDAKNADYHVLKEAVSAAAHAVGRSPREYSAEAWVGIRETIKATGELYGQKINPGALRGESKGYADHFTDLIRAKAEHLGISVGEMERRLTSGDAELLSMMLATPAIAVAYKQWQNGATE